MKIVVLIAITIFSFMMSGCGSKTGVQSSAQKSYLYFTGNTKSIEVSIDKGESFSVESGANNHYGVNPGKHLVEVTRDGTLIIKREIYLGDGIAKEIEVQ